MATRNKKKLAALNKENCEEHPRSNLAQNWNAPRSQEDYITQVSQEIAERVTKKLSQELSRTENRILGAIARLDGFLMNPHYRATPEASRNIVGRSQGTNEDDSQSDPDPEEGFFQMRQNSGPEDGHNRDTAMGSCRQRKVELNNFHRSRLWWETFVGTTTLGNCRTGQKPMRFTLSLRIENGFDATGFIHEKFDCPIIWQKPA